MKKKRLILAAMAIAVCLTACGGSGAGSTGNSQSQTSVESSDAAGTKEETQVQSGNTSQGSDETKPQGEDSSGTNTEKTGESDGNSGMTKVEPVHIVLEEVRLDQWSNDPIKNIAELKYHNISLTAEDEKKYPQLAKNLKEYDSQLEQSSQESFERLVADYRDSEDWFSQMDNMRMEENEDAYVVRADSNAVSVLHDWYAYWGGAHPIYGYYALNYDTQSGKRLAFADVVKDVDAFFVQVENKLWLEYEDSMKEMLSMKEYCEGTDFSDPNLTCWSVGNEGVTYYFDPYVLGSYAMGAQIVTIYYEEAPELFVEKYTQVPDSYVIPVDRATPLRLDVKGKGIREEISIDHIYVDEMTNHWGVHVGSRSLTIEDWGYDETSYIVRANGKYYLYLFEISESDFVTLLTVDLKELEYDRDRCTYGSLFDFNQSYEEADERNIVRFSTVAFTDPTEFVLGSRMNLLGTYSGYRSYSVGKDGYPAAKQEFYEASTAMVMRNKLDLDCETTDASGKVTGKAVVPAGTYLFVVRTDDAGWADVQIADPSVVKVVDGWDWVYFYADDPLTVDASAPAYRIYVDQTEYPFRINDMDESDVIEGIMYAG